MVLWLSNSLLQYGGFAVICTVSNIPIHCSKSLVKHVLVYIGKLWWGAAKAGGCLWYCKRYRTYCVCILCIVEQRRKSWSIHIFNNVLLAYQCVLFLAGWLLYMIHTKNSCRILCISYVHFICNHCHHSDRRRYLYCYLLVPVRTYTDTYILIWCSMLMLWYNSLGILICRVATKPAQSIHSLYLHPDT